MVVVGDVFSPVELLLAVRDLTPDVVFVPLDEENNLPGVCSHVVGEAPAITIVGISELSMKIVTPQVGDSMQAPVLPYSDDAVLAAVRRAGRGAFT